GGRVHRDPALSDARDLLVQGGLALGAERAKPLGFGDDLVRLELRQERQNNLALGPAIKRSRAAEPAWSTRRASTVDLFDTHLFTTGQQVQPHALAGDVSHLEHVRQACRSKTRASDDC